MGPPGEIRWGVEVIKSKRDRDWNDAEGKEGKFTTYLRDATKVNGEKEDWRGWWLEGRIHPRRFQKGVWEIKLRARM